MGIISPNFRGENKTEATNQIIMEVETCSKRKATTIRDTPIYDKVLHILI